jgi:hypothetical protein
MEAGGALAAPAALPAVVVDDDMDVVSPRGSTAPDTSVPLPSLRAPSAVIPELLLPVGMLVTAVRGAAAPQPYAPLPRAAFAPGAARGAPRVEPGRLHARLADFLARAAGGGASSGGADGSDGAGKLGVAAGRGSAGGGGRSGHSRGDPRRQLSREEHFRRDRERYMAHAYDRLLVPQGGVGVAGAAGGVARRAGDAVRADVGEERSGLGYS